MKFVYCPICGHKLLEGHDGSLVKVKCNKCKSILEVNILKENITVIPIKTDTSK